MSERSPIEARVLEATRRGGKTHGFDDAHDPIRPVDHWFQRSADGEVLFLVFYSQACRWSMCTGCNLPMTASLRPIPFDALMRQIDGVFEAEDVRTRAPELTKLIVSNQGSVLDEVTFSSTALIYLVAKCNLHLPALEVLCLETRAEYVDEAELEFLARTLKEGARPTALELAVGFEAFDDHLRNQRFKKGLTLSDFEELVGLVARHGFHLKTYFMHKPVADLSDEDAVADVTAAIDYLSAVAERTGVRISMHLNPTYAARGTELARAFLRGQWAPPQLRDVARAVLHGRDRGVPIYVGLNDEGMAVEGGGIGRPEEAEVLAALREFNRTGDFEQLGRAVGA